MSSTAIQVAPKAAQVSAAILTAQIFPNLSIPTLPAILNVPAGGRLEQQKFKVRASGYATTQAATTTVLLSLFGKPVVPGTPLTPANWTLLGASTARVVNTTSCPWWIEADLTMDSISGKLGGTFNALINDLYDASAPIANILTGLNATSYPVVQGANTIPAVEPAFAVCVGITFGVNASVGNIGNLGNLILLA